MVEEVPVLKRGGFWRRGWALIIDGLIWSVVVIALSLVLTFLTGGRLRVSNAIINQTECFKLDRSYPEIRLPRDFKVTGAGRCVRTILGYSFDRYVLVQEKIVSGSITTERSLTFPLDRDGNVTSAYYLDWLALIVTIVVIYFQEAQRGDTSGKRAMGLRVQALGGGKASHRQIALRLVRFIYLVPMIVAVFALAVFSLEVMTFAFWALGVGGALSILTIGEFIWANRRDGLPFYDRLAGTEVVRIFAADAVASPDASVTPPVDG